MASPKPASAANIKNPITENQKAARTPPPPYWHTLKGRNLISMLTAGLSGVYFSGYTILHTFCLDQYKRVVQLHKYGFPTPMTPNMVVVCQKTLEDMQMKLKNPNMINFFCVYGMDMFHAGSLKLRGGSIIGVPRSFSYTTKEMIEKNDIVVENKHIEWGSDGGEMLQDALVLSERAQKFGIAREIMMSSTYSPYVHGGIGATSILTYLVTARTVNKNFYGLQRPRSFRYCVYAFVGTMAVGIWSTATDLITKYYENWADSTTGNLSLEFAKGGVEFYSKILQRNMALRSLMGPNGEKTFTFYGNDVEFIRQKHVPYTDRKKNLENIAENLSKSGERINEG